eukprot:scaffold7403_cov277-Pinguiococcus_pyrenoidosus.AAC.14
MREGPQDDQARRGALVSRAFHPVNGAARASPGAVGDDEQAVTFHGMELKVHDGPSASLPCRD